MKHKKRIKQIAYDLEILILSVADHCAKMTVKPKDAARLLKAIKKYKTKK